MSHRRPASPVTQAGLTILRTGVISVASLHTAADPILLTAFFCRLRHAARRHLGRTALHAEVPISAVTSAPRLFNTQHNALRDREFFLRCGRFCRVSFVVKTEVEQKRVRSMSRVCGNSLRVRMLKRNSSVLINNVAEKLFRIPRKLQSIRLRTSGEYALWGV
jgi:hypothetical protein